MIENSLYLALAASFLFGLPQYKKLIASRKKRVELGRTKFYGDLETEREIRQANPGALSEWDYDDSVDFDLPGGNSKDVLVFYRYDEVNFFNRKPFTCLLCMTFWLCIGRFAFILLFCQGGLTDLAPAFAAPILAEAFTRWFKSLPISL